MTMNLPPLPPMPKLRAGKTLKDALDYLGIDLIPGMNMDDLRDEVARRTRADDPRRTGAPITTVEQAERAIHHWATAPFEGCGNYPLMSTCEGVNLNGDCPRTKYCVFAESLRETMTPDQQRAAGYAADVEATENGIGDLLCPFWDPESGRDNTDEWLLPVGTAR